jgi:hypothetical protein
MTDLPDETVIKPSGLLRAFVIVWLAIWIPVTGAMAIRDGGLLLSLYLWLVAAGIGIWGLRPEVVADRGGLRVRGPWRTVSLRWNEVRDLQVRRGGPGYNLYGRTIVATIAPGKDVWLSATWRTVRLHDVEVMLDRLEAYRAAASTA